MKHTGTFPCSLFHEVTIAIVNHLFCFHQSCVYFHSAWPIALIFGKDHVSPLMDRQVAPLVGSTNSTSIRKVYKAFGIWNLIRMFNAHFQIACTVMADLANVAAKVVVLA